ncbi:MAG: formylmethanofuran dehydrogenase subunit E family protein [candidate division WOR-3 bacterium]|nr:MAG: formylmethanofuran dehydrogenase subunit E family protein [candidate division WOR-3 bacterium]
MKFKRPQNLTYTETIRFHGHDGPFLALGYRLGRFVVRTMRPTGIMDLRIRVTMKTAKPYTCILDGLQCSTLATVGKGNLSVHRSSGRAITINVYKGRTRKAFKIKPHALDICLNAVDLGKAARRILRMQARDLWS